MNWTQALVNGLPIEAEEIAKSKYKIKNIPLTHLRYFYTGQTLTLFSGFAA